MDSEIRITSPLSMVARGLGWAFIVIAAVLVFVGLAVTVVLPDLDVYGMLAIIIAVAALTFGVGLVAASHQ